MTDQQEITPELLLNAYASGYFPMAENSTDKDLHWFNPRKRGVIPLENFHIPRSLAKALRSAGFTLTADRAFAEVITACAEATAERPQTWISQRIIDIFTELHQEGFAHSIECWKDEQLVGGLYGVALGGAFFGESMFSRTTNASKAALVELVKRLKSAGYTLLDTQYVNDHLLQFGCIEIPKSRYLKQLEAAILIAPTEAFG